MLQRNASFNLCIRGPTTKGNPFVREISAAELRDSQSHCGNDIKCQVHCEFFEFENLAGFSLVH